MATRAWVGKKVLIVDDSPHVREGLRRVYEECGMEVVGLVANGVEALDFVAATPPDVVSLDLIMPEMDGIECFRKLKAQHPEVRCVVVSWLAGEPKVVERLAGIIPAYLLQPKPATASSLQVRLEKAFNPPAPIPVESVAELIDLGAKVS